ncbi:MAG: ATP-binding cassette domain-containing protein, partial [Gammaproteobacteria bacterium]|nr:ATP-binding cassette domain-containing protein [Gammaproteobacteria bacterium]
NGAGKTTLFNLLSGELRPQSGSIHLAGREVTRLTPDRRARLGLARSFQRNNVFPQLSVRENLSFGDLAATGQAGIFWRPIRRRGRDERAVERAADLVGIRELLERRVSDLSYGAVRQLEIGLALVSSPKLLLLDEPTSGMSPEETGRILRLLGGLPRDLTMVIIEHDMPLVFELADRITVLDHGKVLESGSVEQIRGSARVRAVYLGEAG